MQYALGGIYSLFQQTTRICRKVTHRNLKDSSHYSTATASCLLKKEFELILNKNIFLGGTDMETRGILKKLREKRNLTQEELAEQIQVTRQAVSRWETGETQPNTDTLKLLSQFFDVSINTLLGSPRQLICQCCGMPLNEDELISREPDGSYNEDYCKWCYTDGKFAYQSKESLLDYLVANMPNPDNADEKTRRNQFHLCLSQLKHWE